MKSNSPNRGGAIGCADSRDANDAIIAASFLLGSILYILPFFKKMNCVICVIIRRNPRFSYRLGRFKMTQFYSPVASLASLASPTRRMYTGRRVPVRLP